MIGSSASAAAASSSDDSVGGSFAAGGSTQRSVLMNGDSPFKRCAITPSGSCSPSSTRARRNRSMLARSHGSRATRSSAMKRASVAEPAAMYASASCACALYIVASRRRERAIAPVGGRRLPAEAGWRKESKNESGDWGGRSGGGEAIGKQFCTKAAKTEVAKPWLNSLVVKPTVLARPLSH